MAVDADAKRLLSDEEISTALADLPGWDRQGDKLAATFNFADFSEAFGFMSRVALISERQVAYEIRSGVLQRVPVILETTRMIGLTQRRDWVPSHPHERLIAVFETLV